MEEHVVGDGARGPEQKCRSEDMRGRVEELKGEVKENCETKDGSELEVVQSDGVEPQGEGRGSAETKGEKRGSDAPDDTASKTEETQAENSNRDELKGENTREDEPRHEEPEDSAPEREDAKNGLDVTEAHDDDPPNDHHDVAEAHDDDLHQDNQSTSGTEAPSESQESALDSPQSTLADSDEDRRCLEHCAPEVVEEPPVHEEKKLDLLPSTSPEDTFAKTDDDLPSHCRQHRHNGLFWSPPSPLLEPVPVYPGDPTTFPEVVDAPMELEASLVRPSGKMICGLRKRQFLIIFGIVVLVVVVVAVSVGVGVAYGTRRKSDPDSASPTPWPLKPCDAIHNTTFTTKNGKVFQRLCFIDYGGTTAEATDITGTKTPSMEECMKACSELEECTGAGWGPANGVNTYRTMCWMKKNLKKPHRATADFEFAVLISGNVTVPSMEPYF